MPEKSKPASAAALPMNLRISPISINKNHPPCEKELRQEYPAAPCTYTDIVTESGYASAMRLRPWLLTFSCLVCTSLAAPQQATVPVTLVLTDPTGAAIPNTQIRVIPAPDPTPRMETDEKGKLALQLKPGGYALFARVFGFKPLAVHFEVKANQGAQSIPFILQLANVGGPVAVQDNTEKTDLSLIADPYHAPTGLSLAQLKALPHITVTIHNSHTQAEETYSGIRLADLLTSLGAPLGKELRGIAFTSYVIASGSDGYQVVLSLGEIDPTFHPGEVIVADAMNSKPLDEHSGPLKLVVSEDKRPARAVRNLVSIELRSAQ